MQLIRVFTVRIVYKSGYTHDFRCTTFSLKNGTYTWTSYDDNNKPIELGGPEIAAVWQLGYVWRLSWNTEPSV